MSELRRESGDQAPLNVGMVQQLRQMSLPLWVRLMVFLVALGVLGIAAFFFLKGIAMPPSDPDWFDLSAKIFAATFLPFLAVAYLAFAETGVGALQRKTCQMLTKTIPDALRSVAGSDGDPNDGFDPTSFLRCQVHCSHHGKSPLARYRVTVNRGVEHAILRCVISINVGKAIVVVFVPALDSSDVEMPDEMFCETFAGAVQEGYEIDQYKALIVAEGKNYFKVVARKPLQQDFLWDPGQQLHYAQDLSAYLFSFLNEAWPVFRNDLSSFKS